MKKITKSLSILGVGLTTITTSIASTISLSSCKKDDISFQTRESFNFSDEAKTTLSSLTPYAKKQTKLVIPKTVKKISEDVFQNLKSTNIQEIDLSNCLKITTLPSKAFLGSSNIKTLLLPPNLKTINKDQISDLVNIERINWPSTISTEDMIKATWDLPIFIPFTNNDWTTLFHTSTSCDGKTLSVKEKKASIFLLPNTCVSLRTSWQEEPPKTLKYFYFQDNPKLEVIGKDIFRYSYFERIILPSTLKEIQTANFFDMKYLVELVSVDNFKNLSGLGRWNFNNLPKLKYLDFSANNSLTRFYEDCFKNLASLEYLLLPNSIVSLKCINSGQPYNLFDGAWDSLKYVPMPKNCDFSDLPWHITNRFSEKVYLKTPENNKVNYDDLYGNKNIVGIWISGSSKTVNKPDISKIPNLKFISYRDKTEYFAK